MTDSVRPGSATTATATISTVIRQIGPSSAEGSARTHRVLIDRPLEKGGADAGMMGGEYLLIALGGCFTSNLLAAIHARGADVQAVQVEVTGTLKGAPSRFSEVELRVSARHADPELMRKLIEIADRGCIVANTLRGALELQVRLAEAPRSA